MNTDVDALVGDLQVCTLKIGPSTHEYIVECIHYDCP